MDFLVFQNQLFNQEINDLVGEVDFYIAIYGNFANRVDAEKAAVRFARLKPWIRDFGSIQKIMSK